MKEKRMTFLDEDAENFRYTNSEIRTSKKKKKEKHIVMIVIQRISPYLFSYAMSSMSTSIAIYVQVILCLTKMHNSINLKYTEHWTTIVICRIEFFVYMKLDYLFLAFISFFCNYTICLFENKMNVKMTFVFSKIRVFDYECRESNKPKMKSTIEMKKKAKKQEINFTDLWFSRQSIFILFHFQYLKTNNWFFHIFFFFNFVCLATFLYVVSWGCSEYLQNCNKNHLLHTFFFFSTCKTPKWTA